MRPLKSAAWQARIERVGGGVAGAGFLVAPRTVLTCAHVVHDLPADELAVSFAAFPGRPAVPARRVAGGGWDVLAATDLGDLAVLELAEDAPSAPAALAPADTAYGTPPRKLVVYGFPDGFDEGTLAEYRVTAPQLISGEWLQLEAWQLGGQPLAPGFSGAAVTLVDTGEVVGMVTADAGAQGVRTGRMMPTEVMARHWPALEGLVPTSDHHGADRARLRGLVERAERTGLDCDPVRLYRAAAGELAPEPPEEGFDSLWSAALFVLCELDGPDAAATVARFADLLADLVREQSTAPVERPGTPEWSPILVDLRHSGAGDDLVRVEVSAYSGGRRHPVDSGTVPRSRLPGYVQDRIDAAFQYLTPGCDELIAFALPRDWLDLPVDRWHLGPEDETPLGCRHPLVVTDQARRKAGTRHVLTRAWNRLDTLPGARMHRVECTEQEAAARLRLKLLRADSCLVGFAAAPSAARAHFTTSLTAPAPLVAWSRRGCPGGDPGPQPCTGGDGCTGKTFLDELDACLADRPPAELPRRVWELRLEADAEDDHWARDLQLLWDDPRVFPDPHATEPAHARSPVA